jgi:hypothetical protein
MPAAALMEIALQPCGWLGCYVGSPVQIDAELLFRNLDGNVRVLREVRPGTRVVRTRAELADVSRAAGMIRLTVELEITAAGQDERGRYALADGWLWVDGRRIYHVTGLGVRVVAGDQPSAGGTA